MFRELEQFNNASTNIDARINQLRNELQLKTAEHEQAAAKFSHMFLEDSTGMKISTPTDLNKAKLRVEELASELKFAEERLHIVEKGKVAQLTILIGEVRQGWARENERLTQQINAVFEATREHRAKLTFELQKANKFYLEGKELLKGLQQAEQRIGMDYMQQTRGLGVPEQPLIKDFEAGSYVGPSISDRSVIPSERELINAYQNGEVPAWISRYVETGKLIPVALPLRASGGLKGMIEKVKKVLPKFGQGDIVTAVLVARKGHEEALETWEKSNPGAHIVEIDNRVSNQPVTIRYVPAHKVQKLAKEATEQQN